MNDLRKTLVNDLNDVETALCALEGVKPGTIRQNGYTGDFKGVMAYPVLLVQKGREKGMTDYTKLVKELRETATFTKFDDLLSKREQKLESLAFDAAAAIEALEARLGEAENSVERWKDMYLTKHEPKRGEWIVREVDSPGEMHPVAFRCMCSMCLNEYVFPRIPKYCPDCGSMNTAKTEVQE